MAKPSPKPQPIAQNPDGTFSLNTFLGGSKQFPATQNMSYAQNMSVMPPKPFTPITTASTGIPNVGIPGIKGVTTPINPYIPIPTAETWKTMNTAMQNVPDSI
jgi:hypothetical protein